MPTRVRSFAKINLGLAIGRPRPDGFHALETLYQTLALHDFVSVTATRAPRTSIVLTSNDPRVPTDARNTAWKMVDATLARLGLTATVEIGISKHLPIQGGMGAGSANAAAALLGLERELGLDLDAGVRLEIAAAVGSDVPLFLVGGSVLGSDRGQIVAAVPDLTLGGVAEIPCVIALPGIGVSTPNAFRDWDRQFVPHSSASASGLRSEPIRDTIIEMSRTFASVFRQESAETRSGASGILPDPCSGSEVAKASETQGSPEKLQGLTREQRHTSLTGPAGEDASGMGNDLAENTLLALVRTGIENDFETVVFPQYPFLREIKRHLMGSSATGNSAGLHGQAIYAALSGSGSALFGLYLSTADAHAAQHRLQQHGVKAIVTSTMPRPLYWTTMFAE